MWVRMDDFASKPMQDFSPRTGNGLAVTNFLLRTNLETRKRNCSRWCLEDNTSQTAAPEDAFPGRESLMLSERPESCVPSLGVLLRLPWCFLLPRTLSPTPRHPSIHSKIPPSCSSPSGGSSARPWHSLYLAAPFGWKLQPQKLYFQNMNHFQQWKLFSGKE